MRMKIDYPRVAFHRIGFVLGVRSPDYQFRKAKKAGVIEQLPSGLYRINRKRARKYARKHGYRARARA